jgi:hypothetical protein
MSGTQGKDLSGWSGGGMQGLRTAAVKLSIKLITNEISVDTTLVAANLTSGLPFTMPKPNVCSRSRLGLQSSNTSSDTGGAAAVLLDI